MLNPGQMSEDGKWRWDGRQWVPVQQALAQPGTYPQAMVAPTAPTNSLAVVSLVVGIVSWFLCPIIGAIVAIVTGHIARGQIRRSGEAGGGLAIVGLVLGYIHLVAWGLFIVFWGLLFGGLAVLGGLAGAGSH